MSPDSLASLTSFGSQIHVTINSSIIGFIDDMYIVAQPYPNLSMEPDQVQLSMQSQLRLGSGDFMQNYNHIKAVLDCLNTSFENADAMPRPCSLTN